MAWRLLRSRGVPCMPIEPPLTPEEVGDALAVIAMGGNPRELVHALNVTAARTSEREARGRLQRAAEVLAYAGEVHAAMQAELARNHEGQP